MLLVGEVKCPGCGLSTKTKKFKAPLGKLFPTTVRMVCSGCESGLRVTFVQAPMKGDRTQLQYTTKVFKPSQALIELLKEEAKHKQKALEVG